MVRERGPVAVLRGCGFWSSVELQSWSRLNIVGVTCTFKDVVAITVC
jgi:hypothetical protein